MNFQQTQRLDNLTIELDSHLAILNSAVQADEGLAVVELQDFISQIYKHSKEIRTIFEDEIIY